MTPTTGFFRHPNGEERRVTLVQIGKDKHLIAFASAATDVSNAAKYLIRSFEGQVADGSSLTELFLTGKLKLTVVCTETFDQRLADGFAKAIVPVSILTMDDLAGNGPPISLTDKTKDHIRSLAQSNDEMRTVVDDETWNKMVASFEATPERKQHKWRFRLSGTGGSSIVKCVHGKFIDHNATTGKPQEVFKVSDMTNGERMPLNERGEHFIARQSMRNA